MHPSFTIVYRRVREVNFVYKPFSEIHKKITSAYSANVKALALSLSLAPIRLCKTDAMHESYMSHTLLCTGRRVRRRYPIGFTLLATSKLLFIII